MKKGKYSIFTIANWFLNKDPMTHKRLQKLCYYATAWYYALTEQHLINDSRFEAWVHGPVSKKLYQMFENSGMKELTPFEYFEQIDDADDLEFLESVWETYKEMGANALEALTHSEPPWQKARIGLTEFEISDREIDYEDMKKYYLSIYIPDNNGEQY